MRQRHTNQWQIHWIWALPPFILMCTVPEPPFLFAYSPKAIPVTAPWVPSLLVDLEALELRPVGASLDVPFPSISCWIRRAARVESDNSPSSSDMTKHHRPETTSNGKGRETRSPETKEFYPPRLARAFGATAGCPSICLAISEYTPFGRKPQCHLRKKKSHSSRRTFLLSKLKILMSTALTKHHSLSPDSFVGDVRNSFLWETLSTVEQIPKGLAIFSFGDAKMSEGLEPGVLHEAALEPLLLCKGKQRNSWFYQGLAACIKKDSSQASTSFWRSSKASKLNTSAAKYSMLSPDKLDLFSKASKKLDHLAGHLGIAAHGTQSSLVRVWNTCKPQWRLQL